MTLDGDSGDDTDAVDHRIAHFHDVAMELQTANTNSAVYDEMFAAAVDILGFNWCGIAGQRRGTSS